MGFLDLALVFFTALILSVLIIPFVLYVAHSKNIYDVPDYTVCNSRRVHIKPIPRLGGIAIVTAFFITLSIWQIPPISKTIYNASLILFFLGLWDDLKNLSAKIRLFVQICVSTFVVFNADLALKAVIISPSIIFSIPHLLGAAISVFVLIGAVNAMNMIDGLDGLASGVVLIAISILSYFLFLSAYKHEFLLLFTVPILGSVIGFLKYNTHPSTIFMGDSGSNWLGFMVGVLILLIANSTHIPTMSLLLTFSIPIFDTAHVIILRLISGKNPMMADDQHFHHSLIKIGFTHAQSVGIIYLFMFFFAFLGMIPVAFKGYLLWWIPWLGAFLLTSILILTIYLRRNIAIKKPFFALNFYKSKYVKKSLHMFIHSIEQAHRVLLGFLLFTLSVSVFLKSSMLTFILVIASTIMCLKFLILKSCSFLSACILVMISSLLFVMTNLDSVTVSLFSLHFKLRLIYNFVFLLLFLSTFLLSSIKIRRGFVITPTDILLILAPLLILMMPNTWENEYGLRVMIMRGLVLFGALRIASKELPYQVNDIVLVQKAI